MTKSDTYCVMPHIGLAIQNNGDVCVCNISKQSLSVERDGNTIDKHALDEFWHTRNRFSLAKDLDAGIRNPTCSDCWEREDTGNTSARQQFNKAFGELEPDQNQPLVLVVKPGNACNSACRYCNPATSSSWYHDAYALSKDKNITFKDYIKKFETIKDSFAIDNPNFWPVVNDWYKKLHFVDIYGGEPWMVAGLWQSLGEAVKDGYSKNISLQLHTNATHWKPEYMDILQEFKSVNIGLSIDSYNPEQFNYVRHKSDFYTVIKNSKRFIEYSKNKTNMRVYISVTIGILNLWNIDKTVESIEKELQIPVGFKNFVYDPDHYDIRHLPKAVKQQVIDKLKNKRKYTPVLNFMNSIVPACEIYWPKFCLETERLDAIRNQNFALTFPEWHAILKPYWDYKKRHPEWYGTV
jgi:hypothetical protein